METVWIGIRVDEVKEIDESTKAYLEGGDILTIGGTAIEAVTNTGQVLGYGWVARQAIAFSADDVAGAMEDFKRHIHQIRDLLEFYGITGTVWVQVEQADPCHIEMWKAAQKTKERLH